MLAGIIAVAAYNHSLAQSSPSAEIKIAGLASLAGHKWAILTIRETSAASMGQRAERHCTLQEGEKDGAVQIVLIDERKGKVKLNNDGRLVTLSIVTDGAELPAASGPTPPLPFVPSAPPQGQVAEHPQATSLPAPVGRSSLAIIGSHQPTRFGPKVNEHPRPMEEWPPIVLGMPLFLSVQQNSPALQWSVAPAQILTSSVPVELKRNLQPVQVSISNAGLDLSHVPVLPPVPPLPLPPPTPPPHIVPTLPPIPPRLPALHP
jgi:hypothetical protein